MKIEANTPEEYIHGLPEGRKEAISKLRKTLLDNLPGGFQECISYGMIGYVVPHRIYPAGYHANPKLPLPFINIASQKNHIALYHSGIYVNTDLLDWFQEEYPKYSSARLDMGKSCIRFKNIDKIPYNLIRELAKKLTPEDWIKLYESQIKKS